MDFLLLRRSFRGAVPAVVLHAVALSPGLRRLVLGGPELAAWLRSGSARTAWVKVFPPGRHGGSFATRQVDPATGTLVVDFTLVPGPGADLVLAWVSQAQVGDRLHVAGLHGSLASGPRPG